MTRGSARFLTYPGLNGHIKTVDIGGCRARVRRRIRTDRRRRLADFDAFLWTQRHRILQNLANWDDRQQLARNDGMTPRDMRVECDIERRS